MFEVFFEKSALILTGIIVTFVSSFLYTMNAQGFIARGRYRRKEEAVFIYLGAAIVLGLITPLIHEGSVIILRVVPALSIIGVLIIGANFIIHYSIQRWNQFSAKSLLIYLLGVLFVLGGLFHVLDPYVSFL